VNRDERRPRPTCFLSAIDSPSIPRATATSPAVSAVRRERRRRCRAIKDIRKRWRRRLMQLAHCRRTMSALVRTADSNRTSREV
jgi:hypothetical protein